MQKNILTDAPSYLAELRDYYNTYCLPLPESHLNTSSFYGYDGWFVQQPLPANSLSPYSIYAEGLLQQKTNYIIKVPVSAEHAAYERAEYNKVAAHYSSEPGQFD